MPPRKQEKPGQVMKIIAEAEEEAKPVTTDAINTTTAFTNWLADTLNKF